MDQEIYSKFKSPGIVTVIKVRRYQWLGHVVRMGSAATVQRLLGGRRTR